jgi:hypothetical protein
MTHQTHTPPRATTRSLARVASATALSVLALGTVAAAPATSSAATFGVVNCGTVYGDGGPPVNGAYPFRDGTSGFQVSPHTNYTQGGRLYSCDDAAGAAPQGKGMRASLEGNYAQASSNRAVWRWKTASDTQLVRYAARFYAKARPYDTSQGRYNYGDVYLQHDGQLDPAYDWRVGSWTTPNYQWQGPYTLDKDLTQAPVAHVDFGAACGAADLNHPCHVDAANTIADLNLQGFQAVIADESNPQVSNVSGDLVDGRYWNRTVGVTASITDKGSGVARTIIQRRAADGSWQDDASQVVDENAGRCVPLTGVKVFTEARVYTSSKPCRTDASGDVSIDTSKLEEGERTYRVLVEDAAGNRAALVGPQARVIDRTAPTVSFAGTPDQCAAGTRVAVQGSATDAVAGVQSIQTMVTDAKANKVPVAADGTIECPPEGSGPLVVTTTAVDKAGNEASATRAQTVAVKAAPVVTPQAPADGTVGGGTSETPTVKPEAPIAAPPAGPAPAPSPAPAPDTRGAAAAELLACSKKGIVLTEAFPSGKKDVLRGVAGAKYVGQTVTVVYGPKRKVVGRIPVGVDGSFTATVKAPKGKGSRGNSARYEAIVAGERSSALKRVRRMYATQVYRTANGGAVYVAGRVTKPFKAGSTVTIQTRAAGCGTSAWSTAKRTKVDARGNYGASFAVGSGEEAVVVRAVGQVQVAGKTVRRSRTQTMPTAVQMR